MDGEKNVAAETGEFPPPYSSPQHQGNAATGTGAGRLPVYVVISLL